MFPAKDPGFRCLTSGYEWTGARSAPYVYLRVLRALGGEGLLSFGCGFAALARGHRANPGPRISKAIRHYCAGAIYLKSYGLAWRTRDNW
jgi:hypothetical protein